MELTKIGKVWTDPESQASAWRLNNAPPLRYVAGAVPFLDIKAETVPIGGVPVKFIPGVEVRVMQCWNLRDEGGPHLASRALNCRGNCLKCKYGELTNTVLVMDRLEAGQWRQLFNVTRRVLVKVTVKVEHLVSRFLGTGRTEEGIEMMPYFEEEESVDEMPEGESDLDMFMQM